MALSLFISTVEEHYLAVGVGFGADRLPDAVALMTAIGLQNMPEGLAVALPLVRERWSRGKALLYALGSGMAEPIAGLIGVVAVTLMRPLLPWGLAFAAGAMLYVVSDEIIPETHSRGFELEGTWGLIILGSLYLEALERLVAAHESLSRPEEALHYAGLLLACDPLREGLYRVTIRLHMRLGNRAEAVRQAWRCRAVLQAELGIEPEPETVALCDELLGSTWRRESGRETLTQRGPCHAASPPSSWSIPLS